VALQMVADALPNVEAVIILTDDGDDDLIVIDSWTIDELANFRNYYQNRALSLLTANATLASKVHVYQLVARNQTYNEDTNVYVHSKLYMADDEYVIIGSHCMERVGFTNDIELSFGVYDSVGQSGPYSWVGTLRRNLWAEHLDLDINDTRLIDPIEALSYWESQAALGTALVRNYWPDVVEYEDYMGVILDIYEYNGLCPDCSTATSCANCVGDQYSCVWCDSSQTCYNGTYIGISNSSVVCSSWYWGQCVLPSVAAYVLGVVAVILVIGTPIVLLVCCCECCKKKGGDGEE